MDFYQTPAHACGYLPDRFSMNIYADPNLEMSTTTYAWLIDHGFRRNGKYLYRPQCPSCKACVPTRVPVNKFKPNRSQQRTLQTNQDLTLQLLSNEYSDEHFELYKEYLIARHADSPMGESGVNDYCEFILGSWSKTKLLEFRLQGKIICMAAFDELPQGLSAVYTFYNASFSKRGLGTLAILKLIQLAKQMDLPYVYLGYWIKACKKMSYKNNFKPTEGYINNKWELF